jgi:hypothetical protein
MLNFVKRQTLHIWIAMMAVLFSALAPTVSHALAASSSTPSVLLEMCTVDGAKSVDGSKQSPTDSMQGMEHCAYCLTHPSTPALPPPPMAGFAVIGGHDLYPALFYSAPQPLHTWSAAKPRGPPTRS